MEPLPPTDSVLDSCEYVVLIPIYEDWVSARALIELLEGVFAGMGTSARVLLIDDGSQTAPGDWGTLPLAAIRRVDTLRMRRNLGHQRAICIGLCHVQASPDYANCRGLVIMDGDGEDQPADVPRLISRFLDLGAGSVVFAERRRRSEGVVFTVMYHLYRLAHRAVTGIAVRVGNFSVVPMHLARRLAVVSEMWNHYAAAVLHARLPIDMVPTVRGTRLHGRSRMNFISLVGHGLSAMSVFSDRIGVRSLVVTMVMMFVLLLAFVATLAVRLLTTIAIPGWASIVLGLIGVLLLQGLLLSAVFTFLIQLGRAGSSFLPARDYAWFIEGETPLRVADA